MGNWRSSLLLLLLFVIPQTFGEFRSFLVSPEQTKLKTHMLWWTETNASRIAFHYQAQQLSPANLKKYGPIIIDYNFCKAVRKELEFRANWWPRNSGGKHQNVLLLYANFIKSSLPDGTYTWVSETGRRFICCDKALRSDSTAFVICGATARPYVKKIKGYNTVSRDTWSPLVIKIDSVKPVGLNAKTAHVSNVVKTEAENAIKSVSENFTEDSRPPVENTRIGTLVIGPIIPL